MPCTGKFELASAGYCKLLCSSRTSIVSEGHETSWVHVFDVLKFGHTAYDP